MVALKGKPDIGDQINKKIYEHSEFATFMDSEIAMCEAKLAKVLALKQCMMQELLMSRVRLV
jgi:hypothetical protein